MKFLVENLDQASIKKCFELFNTVELPRLLKYKRYYEGRHDILTKEVSDKTKPCNRIVTNYCADIVNNYQGYLAGKPVSYSSYEDLTLLVNVLKYNDVQAADAEYLKDALIYGRAFELVYLDMDGEIRFKKLDPIQCFAIYKNDLNEELLAVVRVFPKNTYDKTAGFYADFYLEDKIEHYSLSSQLDNFQFLSEEPHYFGQVPVTVFCLNDEETSIFGQVISLQDAYNKLLSAEIDDFEAFCDAYLVLKGVDAEPEDVQAMKEKRTLVLDIDGSAEFLNKAISDTQIENLLANIDKKIHMVTKSPDFTDESFGTSSGIAMQYKLLGFENTSSQIADNMIKALQKRLELITTYINLLDSVSIDWSAVNITFNRNLPFDIEVTSNVISTLKGTVSDRTLLSLLPFISNVDQELDQLNKEFADKVEAY